MHPAVRDGKVLRLHAMERRIWSDARDVQQARYGLVHRHGGRRQHRAGRHRSARRRSVGQRTVAEEHVDAIQRHAGSRMNHLREDRVSSGADVLRGAANAHAPIRAQLHAGGAGNARGRPRCTAKPQPMTLPLRRIEPLAASGSSSRSSLRRSSSTPSGGATRRAGSCLHRARHHSSGEAPADPSSASRRVHSSPTQARRARAPRRVRAWAPARPRCAEPCRS